MSNNRIILLGGDGFCGWPTALHLSAKGYEVLIVDNFSRRNIDVELECESLTPISTISVRIEAWHELSGHKIRFENIDISKDYFLLLELMKNFAPKAIVHFAELKSAPYSMKSSYHKRLTVEKNISTTNNTLCAIVESGLDIHLVHLGTMGVYGYGTAGIKIPEGYLKVKIDVDGHDHEMEILHPANPGSIYHLTKTQDALLFFYYNKNDNVRITDLHQGVVWGTLTNETKLDERLINRFDYDGDYGTVLNRFLIQAAVGHPITVHGSGEQTRAFININDTVKCIRLAIENAPDKMEQVKIFNQVTETYTVIELAKLVSKLSGAEIRSYKNPRKEDPKNELRVENSKFLALGLDPVKLSDGLLEEILEVGKKYSSRIDKTKIISTSLWRQDFTVDFEGTKID